MSFVFRPIMRAVSSLMGGSPKPPTPPATVQAPAAAPPKKDDAPVQAAADDEKKRAAMSQGRLKSILTGNDGDTTEASVLRKRLLGE